MLPKLPEQGDIPNVRLVTCLQTEKSLPTYTEQEGAAVGHS